MKTKRIILKEFGEEDVCEKESWKLRNDAVTNWIATAGQCRSASAENGAVRENGTVQKIGTVLKRNRLETEPS